MKLYFLRHGESQANLEKVYAKNDAPLTDRGREQARQAGTEAKALQITRVFASDYPRTMDTAHIACAAAGIPAETIVEEPRLRELGVGNLMGTPTFGLPGYLKHQADPAGDTTVEPLADAKARLTSLITSLAQYQDENVLLVGHTGSGTILLGLITGDDSDPSQRPQLPNAQIIEFPSPVGAHI